MVVGAREAGPSCQQAGLDLPAATAWADYVGDFGGRWAVLVVVRASRSRGVCFGGGAAFVAGQAALCARSAARCFSKYISPGRPGIWMVEGMAAAAVAVTWLVLPGRAACAALGWL